MLEMRGMLWRDAMRACVGGEQAMAAACNAFVRGATKVRLVHCTLALVFLGLLLTAAPLVGERVPELVSAVRGGRPSVDAVGSEPVGRKAHRLGRARFGDQELGGAASGARPDRGVGARSSAEEGDLEREGGNGDEEREAIQNGTLSVNTVVDYARWDARVGCTSFRAKHSAATRWGSRPSLQDARVGACEALRVPHVSVVVKERTWVPDTLNNLYSCECGLTCLWSDSDALESNPDAHLYETYRPPDEERRKGEPWRVYMDLEAGRNRADSQDLFVSYHAEDDVQVTYAGAAFHPVRSYHISPLKHDSALVYWSSSRCVPWRDRLAREVLGLLPHHSFGRCLNNVGGRNMEVHMYPECSGAGRAWSQTLHCAMSHYKFVLAIENTRAESYVTEKLFYALDAGAVPIYFGAPNVADLVPPKSIIEGSRFSSMRKLAEYVEKVAADPVLYGEFHAWRRCGAMGPYGSTRAVSLDSLPCRLCAAVSKLGGRNA